MAQKNNIRSIRFSDELTELIDRQVGRTFISTWHFISVSHLPVMSTPVITFGGPGDRRRPPGT